MFQNEYLLDWSKFYLIIQTFFQIILKSEFQAFEECLTVH